MQVPNLSDGSSETQHVLADANCQSSWWTQEKNLIHDKYYSHHPTFIKNTIKVFVFPNTPTSSLPELVLGRCCWGPRHRAGLTSGTRAKQPCHIPAPGPTKQLTHLPDIFLSHRPQHGPAMSPAHPYTPSRACRFPLHQGHEPRDIPTSSTFPTTLPACPPPPFPCQARPVPRRFLGPSQPVPRHVPAPRPGPAHRSRTWPHASGAGRCGGCWAVSAPSRKSRRPAPTPCRGTARAAAPGAAAGRGGGRPASRRTRPAPPPPQPRRHCRPQRRASAPPRGPSHRPAHRRAQPIPTRSPLRRAFSLGYGEPARRGVANQRARRGGPPSCEDAKENCGRSPSQGSAAAAPGPGAVSPPAAGHPRGSADTALQFALAENVGGEARSVSATLSSNVVWAVWTITARSGWGVVKGPWRETYCG